jgi:hypothetical protein
MSWNLLIYRAAADGESTEPLGPLQSVTEMLNGAFPGLLWGSPTKCSLEVEGGFTAELTVEDDIVSDVYTRGGFNHLKPLAALCLQEKTWISMILIGGMKDGADRIGLNPALQAAAAAPLVFSGPGDSLLPAFVVAQSPATVPELVR